MKTLKRCGFCNQIININELGLKDDIFGLMCKACHTWLNENFLPKFRGGKKCL